MKRLTPLEREDILQELLQELPLARETRTLFIDPGLPPFFPADTWHRFAFHNQPAQAWVPKGSYAQILIRIPKDRESVFFLLHAAASVLTNEGEIFLYGMNDEGMRSATEKAETLFTSVETVQTKHHARIIRLRGVRHDTLIRAHLEDWRATVPLQIGPRTLELISYPGTFAHGQIDPGTALLLAHLPPIKPKSHVLDVGAGIGTLSCALHLQEPEASFDLLDVSAVALAAAKENLPSAHFILGDGLEALKQERYDFVISNPPVHEDRMQSTKLLSALIEAVPRLLLPSGELRLVIQHTIPFTPFTKEFHLRTQIIAENEVYVIWRITR